MPNTPPRASTPPPAPAAGASASTPSRRTPGRAAATPKTATPSRKRAAEGSAAPSPATKRVAESSLALQKVDDEDENAVEESMDLDEPSSSTTLSFAQPLLTGHTDNRPIRPAASRGFGGLSEYPETGPPAEVAQALSSSTSQAKSLQPATAVTPGRPVAAVPTPAPQAEAPATAANTARDAVQSSETSATTKPPATPVRTSPRTARTPRAAVTPAKATPVAHSNTAAPVIVDAPSTTPLTTPSAATIPARPAEVPSKTPEPAETKRDRVITPGPSTMPVASDSSTTAPAPPPQAKTPRSRRSAAHTAESNRILSAPIEPIEDEGGPVQPEGEASEWGKRWEITQSTIELAVKAATQRWTARDMETCFPTLAKRNPKGIQDVHVNIAHSMRSKILAQAEKAFEASHIPRTLRMIDEVVDDAKNHAAKHEGPRPDAWRPDISPQAMAAATNLVLYDQTWDRLRTEYKHLHADITARYAALRDKQAQLKEIEGSVADGVIDLEKTIKLMSGYPTAEMTAWMESVTGSLSGPRLP